MPFIHVQTNTAITDEQAKILRHILDLQLQQFPEKRRTG